MPYMVRFKKSAKKELEALGKVNLDVVSGFYRYIDDIWNMIPGTCKELNWRNKQLERFIESN